MRNSWIDNSASPGQDDSEPPPGGAAILPLPTRKMTHGRMLEPPRNAHRRGLVRMVSGVGRISAAAWNKLSGTVASLLERFPTQRKSKVVGRSARELIISAMKNRAMLRLRYEGHFGYLDVEPQGLGRDESGRLLLWCYEIANAQECENTGGWHLLLVADIVAAFPSGESYSARPWPEAMPFASLIARMEQPGDAP